MEDDSDLQEGEAISSICQGFDPLDDLAYLDERIENTLGHLQKAFEGGVLSAELLGQKYGGYGTFLSSCEDSLPAPLLRGTPQRSPDVQRHPSSLPGKNAVRNLGSLRSASCNLKSNQDEQNKRDSDSPSIQTSGKVSMKKGNTIMRANYVSDHKPIRVRIKMGSEILSQKVAVVHRGLGLDDSPNLLVNLPPVKTHDNSCRVPPYLSLDTPNESPSRILREMTSAPVSEGQLMSPLPHTLLHAKEKLKQETVVDNEPVVEIEKELPVLPSKKFCDAFGSGKTLNGSKKSGISSIDATICKESPSLAETKKQKKFAVGQRTRKNTNCGLDRLNFSNDPSTFESMLQKDINKDGESDPEVAPKKSNEAKLSCGRLENPYLVSSEKLTKAPKSKASVCNNRFGAELVSGTPFKGVEHIGPIGQNDTDIGLGSEAAPPPTSLELDSWVQCDRCETWRLLPSGIKPEQLPDKWTCSMQIWLPNMNRCGLSQEETANAVISLLRISGSQTHNLENGVINLVSDAGRVDRSHQPLTSGNHSAVQRSKVHDLGIACQARFKRKKENHQQENDNSKKTKDADANKLSKKDKSKENPGKLNLVKSMAEKSTKPSDNGFPMVDMERDTEKKVRASQKKLDHQSKPATGDNFLAAKAFDKTIDPVTREKLMEYKCNYNGNHSELLGEGENNVSPNQKYKTSEVSIADHKEMKTRQKDGMHLADGFREYGRVPVSRIANLSSSKVLGSHKSGSAYAEEVKALPVESISSSRTRSSCLKDLASGGDNISQNGQNTHYSDAGDRTINRRTYLEGDCEFESVTQPRNDKQSDLEICGQNSKFGGLYRTNRNAKSRQDQLQDYLSESRADPLQSPVSQDNVLKSRSATTKVSALTRGTMDSSCQVANDVLKEANKLRKLADCLKSSGFECEHKEASFKASLKFLYGASLLEMCSGENVLNETMNHVEAYSTAAKLSESCALEYESNQEMAAAALAYKCTEVSCMRIIYGRSLGASRDWNSLQKVLQTAPKGESPCSSASDIDNFNHQGVVNKSCFSTGGLPRIAGNHHNVARSQQNFVQLLDFAEVMNLAMEASTKSRNAFRAATVTLKESEFRDCVSSIKTVVNFSFHNVEVLIRQVELALDGLSRSNFAGVRY
ncbi:PREDICTED: uncharacterized protein LOC104808944 isoform X2 [Tarenaya hassleriana]|uniref:uncharacterized protein LOC104808944 isoform X2 n=1 Tax=Tarenaya hassleriana TaxID=28532 RepID=UPI00053C9FC9|nr:PREDICTED: uncharacterized protein LOC104808944 isoform X2 [Tarenaya hassleriana]